MKLVAALAQPVDYRSQHEHVRRRAHVDQILTW
jgi:hypothetical protein